MLTQDELVSRVCGYDPYANAEALKRAYQFSREAHATQRRDSGEPYFSHPVEVAEILAKFRLDTESIVTALLHDTLEDTVATPDMIKDQFGDDVAVLVDGVTKLSSLEHMSRDQGQAEDFRKLLLATSRDIRVLLVKLADRLHNMRTLHHIRSPERRQRIARETMDIYMPLAGSIGVQEIREELEDLAFRELYPEAAKSIIGRLDFLKQQHGDVITQISDEVSRTLLESAVEAWVSGRIKKPASIWRKMQKKDVAFERLTDIIAFRIVVASPEDCYRALGIVHTAYRVIPGEFDDYISTPKRNGYQSLHTAVIGPDLHRIEVQIRSTAMHEVAELGVAAHWRYKMGAPLEGRSYAWVHRLLDILEDAGDPNEFLENTKREIDFDQVFCFTPKGKIITLPSRATPIDFAYAVHSEIGDRCVGASINGKMAPLQTELSNGDQVEILTSEDGVPSALWEQWAQSGKARSRIRRYIRDQERSEFTQLGRALLDRAFRMASVTANPELTDRLCQYFKASDFENLSELVGRDKVTVDHIIAQIPGASFDGAKTETAYGNVIPFDLGGGNKRVSVPIQGLSPGMAVHKATCCHPLPGDHILGILVSGKGVVVHTRDCETLETLSDAPERWIDISWDLGPEAAEDHVGRINLTIANEPGALGKVTTLIGERGGNISNIKISDRSRDFFRMVLDIEVDSSGHLNDIIAMLRATRAITTVERARG